MAIEERVQKLKHGREAISPAKRSRLEKLFEHAKKNPNDCDYATELLTQCVMGDPGNVEYVRAFLENLQRKYRNNKKGCSLAQFKERSARGALKKALAQQQWDDVVKHGLKVLALNPWDISALTAMATAAASSGHRKCELCYLQTAVAGAPRDPTCNRLYAIALGERGMIDQAITFWHRVEEILLNDDEAKRAITALTIEKANSRGEFNDDDVVARTLRFQFQQREELVRQQKLERKVQAEPENSAHYVELAQIYVHEERYEEAEALLAEAYELSDGDPDVREKWEDAQLRRLRNAVATAKDPEAKKKLYEEYLEKDVEVCRSRVERFPATLRFRYDLGYRYMLTKRYVEAIRELQIAAGDLQRKGACKLLLGQCFQQIKRYDLAMSHYESAIQDLPSHDAASKKRSLYLAGRLALAMKDNAAAERHLTALANLDFNYKDGAALLDGIVAARTAHLRELAVGKGA